MLHAIIERPDIAAGHPINAALYLFRKAPPFGLTERLGAQHRSERQRQETRQTNGRNHCHRQFAEQQACLPCQKHDRHEHCANDQCRGNDGKADFARAIEGSQQGRLALLHAMMDILQHHDGIIDHKADRQHQGQQGQEVDRITEDPQNREGGEQTDRHCDRGNDRGAPATKEQENHERHEDRRFDQRPPHALDRLLDEQRGIAAHQDGHAGRQFFRELRNGTLRCLSDLKRVRPRLADNTKSDALFAIETITRIEILGHFFDARDVS